MKKMTAIAAGAILMIVSACSADTSGDDAALADAVEALQDEIDRLQEEDAVEALQDEIERLQSELDAAESADEPAASNSGSSADASSDQESSSTDSDSASTVSASVIPEPTIDSNGTAADQETAERIAEDLGCEGSHEMDGRHMPCASHDEGSMLVEEYLEETESPYPSDGLYDTAGEAEEAAQMAACEGSHEMNGQYMPCDEHDEYVDNMGMIEAAGPVELTEDGLYATEEEALAAAAAAGCTGTHQMGDQWMMCDEHAEGEQVADEMVDEVEEAEAAAEEAPEANENRDGTVMTTSDPLIDPFYISYKDSRTVQVFVQYDGRSLSSPMEVCITHYNQYGNATGCRPGNQLAYSKNYWTVTCQRGINGSPKNYYTIKVLKGGSEIARIDVPKDSPYRC